MHREPLEFAEALTQDANNEEQLALSNGAVVMAVIRFNLRLFLDGAKDIILAPLSLVAGCIALVLPARHAPAPLRFLLRTTRALDEFIDLYELPELASRAPSLNRPPSAPVVSLGDTTTHEIAHVSAQASAT